MNDPLSTSRSETRERIVEAARQLFFQQGYAATGMAEILRDSKASSGSLYHFFATKEDLLVAVLEKYKTMLETHVIGPAFGRATDPVERVFAVIDGYRQLLQATDFNLGCPIGNLALEISNSHPNVRRLITENFDAWCEAVGQCIEEASGRLPPGTDTAQLARYVLATMEGAVMLARTYRSSEPFDDAIQQLRDHFERLVADGTNWSSPRSDNTPLS
jgi:TetR/AcrR family transcriptional regulator, transcriptional repressor for nem operon